tara:strand:- start:35 stop:496 length:462 start_codon:yes stop_codon:yes gene_type:complete
MKLLMENWRQYLDEDQEELDEGRLQKILAGLGLLAGMAIGGGEAQAAPTSADSGVTTHQVQSIPDGYTNVDGVHTFKVSDGGELEAKAGLTQALGKSTLSGMTVKKVGDGAIATWSQAHSDAAQQAAQSMGNTGGASQSPTVAYTSRTSNSDY